MQIVVYPHPPSMPQTMEEKPSSWKKLSAVSQASANPGTMDVKMHRSYHLNDEDETEVDMENIAKGKSVNDGSKWLSRGDVWELHV